MLLLELAHVDGGHVLLAAIEQVGHRQRRLGLADAGCAGHQEHADRLARIGQPGARCADGLRDGVQRMVLPDDALHQLVLEAQHGVDLVRHHPADRNAGPGRDHLGHRLAIDHRMHQRLLALQRIQRGGGLGEFASWPPRCPRARRCRPRARASARLPPRCDGAGRASSPPASSPAPTGWSVPRARRRPSRVRCSSAARREDESLPVASSRPMAPSSVSISDSRRWRSSTGAGIEAWLMPTRAQAVSSRRHALVGQLPRRDVARRELHRLGDRLVQDAHAVVLLQRADQAAQHGGGQRLGGLVDLDHLEAAGQRGVLLEVLLVLGPGGGGDAAQLAARQRRLQQVGGIVLPGLRRRRRSACAPRR